MRTRLRLIVGLTFLALFGASCVVDHYWVDELTLTIEDPLNEAVVRGRGNADGNVSFSWFLCTPADDWEDAYSGAGTHEIEILTESDSERASVTIAAWEDLDSDAEPDCDEWGTTVDADLDRVREATLPVPGHALTLGGASAETCEP
jgi:hypothetical protein